MNQFGTESADSDSNYGSNEMYLFSSSSDSDYSSGSEFSGGSEYGDASDYSSGGFAASYSDSGFVDCMDINVGDDATYCIRDQVCSSEGDAPAGYACPLKDDVAVANCQDGMRSFLSGECVAPRDSVCQKIASGSWGCVWDDELPVVNLTTSSDGGDTDASTSKGEASAASFSGTETTTESVECTNTRVNGDATFCVTGVICSGDGDSPAGDRCPVMGDVAVGDCHDYLASYSNGKCVTTSDGVCKRDSSGTWGCVWSDSDNAASYVIDTSDGNTTGGSSGSNQVLVTGVAAAAAVAAVLAGIAVAWSRHKRQNQRRGHTQERIGMALTPPGSARGSFHRV
ncbi:hypothetical protein PF005_g24338 [Phytophthora fragariae]|uniref:Uncharacterized protein n=5 Tax=Phytophthora fragariae TaxID=53985 RepID=A0A6A4C0X2_9STRA|nr:hypothetical protein PF003_g37572 [Phytophthora fragariae]KAE8923657.1 hypothetical protein PF009_g26091 [Phytophthora fragariae]KAE8975049.1 hypothetical protein PF011_g24627 [Phytophthora fragariae]KAE9073805.1 hypothetical protein PF010_g24924 [Phytophthora fragariae]KAE9074429.1 hypothetical protein PF007_g25410 [Phytophthora fragariae]